jgi:hypothetical protein
VRHPEAVKRENVMSYIELRYYRAYALEVREFGDTGWSVHVYAPDHGQGSQKIAVVTTTEVSNLSVVLAEARTSVDQVMRYAELD